ncbi:4Fe-4S dicluster domain-containing protein [bacterium]|nr:4Fe-4S dicluster domain-containing protein [candidate division CSSED10-310 bacterium]
MMNQTDHFKRSSGSADADLSGRMNDIDNASGVRPGIRIDLDAMDLRFADEVAGEPGGDAVRRCFACSTCTAGCSVRHVTDRFNPRRILRMIMTGQREAVLHSEAIWLCSSCHTCDERCSQGVHIPAIIIALRNIAAREGILPPGYEKQRQLLMSLGRLYEIDDFDNRKRDKSALPAIVTSNALIAGLAESLARDRAEKKPEAS